MIVCLAELKSDKWVFVTWTRYEEETKPHSPYW